MFIYTEKIFNDLLNEELFEEASGETTYIFKDNIYPKIEKVLSTPEGKRKFSRLVEEFINKNSSKLTTVGPMYQIPFTSKDAIQYFELFDVQASIVMKTQRGKKVENVVSAEITPLVKTVTQHINAQANWQLLLNNPIFILFYFVVRYFTLLKDDKMLNVALAITSLAFYPSIYYKYFQFDPNPGVMQYTIDNLSQRFIIKKANHIFGTLTTSIQNSWKFHEKFFKDASDEECIRFIQRIRNDQNSLFKKIAQNYHTNHAKGLSVYTTVDTFDDGINVDIENNTNRVEAITDKIVTQLLVNGVDLKLADFASEASNVSKIELRNCLTKIITDKRTSELKSFIESILFLYLYDEKHTFDEINSRQFISFALNTFKKTNSKNENILNIKKMLNQWGTDTGIYEKSNNVGTRIGYTKAIYLFFITTIQKFN